MFKKQLALVALLTASCAPFAYAGKTTQRPLDASTSYIEGEFEHTKERKSSYTVPYRPQKAPTQSIMVYKGQPEKSPYERLLMRTVPGKDGRERITNTTEWPYLFHSQLSLYFPSGEYGGSGIIVGPHHILTAAHNVYDPQKKEWVNNILAHPALNDAMAPFGALKVSKIFTFEEWVDKGDSNFDIALITLNSSIGLQTGWCGLLSLEDKDVLDEEVRITGYPGDKGFKQMWSMTHIVKRVEPEKLFYDIDTYGGQSGSGIWINKWGNPYVIGIHTMGEGLKYEGNSGTRLSLGKFNQIITEWISKTRDIQQIISKQITTQKQEEDKGTSASISDKTKLSSDQIGKREEDKSANLSKEITPSLKTTATENKDESKNIKKIEDTDDSIRRNIEIWRMKNQGNNNPNLSELKDILASVPSIKELSLPTGREGMFPNNIKFLKSPGQLRKLILEGDRLSTETIKVITQYLTGLTELAIPSAQLVEEPIKIISTCLTNLTNLNLNILGSGCQIISKYLINLTALNLSRMNNGNGPGEKILPYIRSLPNLQTLILRGNHIGLKELSELLGCDYSAFSRRITPPKTPVLTSLTELDIEGNRIGIEGAKMLASFLPNLISLNVANNDIADQSDPTKNGANEILRQLTRLKNLNLNENYIKRIEIDELRPNLISLNLPKSLGNLNLIVKYLPNVTNLKCFGVNIQDENIRVLSNYLKNLTSLDLSHNYGITYETIKAICNYFLKTNGSLIKLNLEETHPQQKPLCGMEIAETLKFNNTLTYLNLGHNNLDLESKNTGKEVALVFAEMIKQNKSLTTLILNSGCFSIKGMKGLVGAMKVNPSITYLDLAWSSSASLDDQTTSALEEMLQENNTLTHLDLTGKNELFIKNIFYGIMKKKPILIKI